MDTVILYSDGSSRGNPGPGGYGTILLYTDAKAVLHTRELSCGYRLTTNNRMELMGVIAGFEALKRPCRVDVCSDSRYVCQAFNEGWIEGWKRRSWKNSQNKAVKNRDLWERLLAATSLHTCTFTWVKGHDGNTYNERCDALATSAAQGQDLVPDEQYESALS